MLFNIFMTRQNDLQVIQQSDKEQIGFWPTEVNLRLKVWGFWLSQITTKLIKTKILAFNAYFEFFVSFFDSFQTFQEPWR